MGSGTNGTEMREDGTVEVYIETPDEKDGFHNMKYNKEGSITDTVKKS